MGTRMSGAEIKDMESLGKRLKGRPQSYRIVLAYRISLRTFPRWGCAMNLEWSRQSKLTCLPVFRLLLALSVSRSYISGEVRRAATDLALASRIVSTARSNADALDAYTLTEYDADRVVTTQNAFEAYECVRAAVTADALGTALRSSRASDYRRRDDDLEATWKPIGNDFAALEQDSDLFTQPLWQDGPPDWFVKADAEMRAIWATDPPAHWAFWTRWWDGVLAGKPLNWDLQRDIALIPDEVWKAGPGPVAKAIAGIELRFELDRLISENPFAWRIIFDTSSRKFEAIAVEQRDLLDIVESVRRSINEFHQRCRSLRISDFGQALELAFAPVVKLLRTDLKRYKDSPLSLLKAIEAARAEMEDIAGKEHFLTESFLTRFLLSLQSDAEDICVASPEIVKQLKAKEAIRYELYTMERRRATMQQTFGLHLDAEGMLKRVALDALRILGDDDATDGQKKEAWYFATAVLPRAARVYLATVDAEEPAPPRATKASLGKRALDAADALSKLDKGKDAIVENVPEALGWIQSIAEGIMQTPPPI